MRACWVVQVVLIFGTLVYRVREIDTLLFHEYLFCRFDLKISRLFRLLCHEQSGSREEFLSLPEYEIERIQGPLAQEIFNCDPSPERCRAA